MGHQVLECPQCKSFIMEGHADWKCLRCNLICCPETNYEWMSCEQVQQVNSTKNVTKGDSR